MIILKISKDLPGQFIGVFEKTVYSLGEVGHSL